MATAGQTSFGGAMVLGENRPATAVAERPLTPVDRREAPERVIGRRPALPGARALVGGLLVAAAAIGIFVAYEGASSGPTDTVVIARRDIHPGEVIDAEDLRVVDVELHDADHAFADVGAVAGRVALGPIGEGELVQAASVTADRSSSGAHEVALILPREQVAVGRLKQGERVDVFVTRDDRTSSVVRGVEVVQIAGDDGGSLTSEREVSLVVAAPSGEAAAALVHALRTGDVTVVRSTFADEDDGQPIEVGPESEG